MKPQRISSSPRLYKCPGSANACARLEDLKPSKTEKAPAATSGEKVHNAIHVLNAEGSIDNLDLTSREEFIATFFSGVVKREIARIGFPVVFTAPEQECFIGNKWIGHWDDAYGFGDKGTILFEYKTGYLHQEPANLHVQGRLYGVSLFDTFPHLTTPLIMFRLSAGEEAGEHVSMCVFSDEDISRARLEADYIYDKADRPDAPRVPGLAQCRYCYARGTPACPETAQTMEIAHALLSQDLKAPEQIGAAMEMWKQCQSFGRNLESVTRSLMESGTKIPGWMFGKPKEPRDIPNVAEGFIRLKSAITQADYLECCAVSVPKVETMLYKKQVVAEGGKKATRKATTEFMEAILGDAMVKVPERAPIVAEKEEDGSQE